MVALRSYVFTFYLALLTLALGGLLSPVLLFGEGPARRVVKLWAKAALFGLRVLCGVTMRIEGAENIPSKGAIIAANHQSMWETVSLYALLPRPVMVFKQELLSIPVYGWWARATGVKIDRESGPRAVRALKRETDKRMANDEQIVIFPEGTRGAPGGLSPLMPGVAGMYLAADAQVTPAVHNSGYFWRYPGVLKTPGEITLRFLAPIPPGLPRREFMRRLEAALRTRLEEPAPE